MPKVTHLTVTNFKRIDAIDIDTAGRFAVVLRGANKQGKSSALDALAVLACGRKEIPECPVNTRSPNTPAVLVGTITGTALGTLTVTRRFTKKGTDLIVKATDADGNTTTISPPQSTLDAVIGAVSIRPLGIISADRTTRLKALTSAGGVSAEWDELERKRKAAVHARTEAARAHDAAERMLGPKPRDPHPMPPAPPDTASKALAAANLALENQTARLAAARQTQTAADAAVHTTQTTILRLRNELVAAEAALVGHVAAARQAAAQADELAKLQASALDQRNEASQAAQKEAAAVSEWAVAEADRRTAMLAVSGWTSRAKDVANATTAKEAAAAEVDRLDAEVTALLHRSRLSQIPGLSIDPEGEVYLAGAPLSQASGMEKVLFGARLALTANPALPLLAIDEADCLDDEAVRALVDFAVEKDISVWLTGVRLPGDEVHAEILAVDIVDGRRAGDVATEISAMEL